MAANLTPRQLGMEVQGVAESGVNAARAFLDSEVVKSQFGLHNCVHRGAL